MSNQPTTNPNGANGTTSDPREQLCWDNYVRGLDAGVENAYKAAVDAGYEDATAKQITVRRWFLERKEALRRKDMLSKAERNLNKTLDITYEDSEGKIIPDLLRIQTDVSKTVVSTLGKNLGYSTRSETDITSKGEIINTFSEEEKQALLSLLK